MDFEKQKPVSDTYRSNYDKIFRKPDVTAMERGRVVYLRENLYANGCPMLPTDAQKDDL